MAGSTSTKDETGSEVLAYCGNCKMDLAAIVVAKVGDDIAKVQCKTCKKERAYKRPKGVKDPAKELAAAAKKTSKKKANAEAESAARAVSIEAEWNRLMTDGAKANKVTYTPKTALKLGDVVAHPSFGDGIVTRLQHPDKAEILFKSDLKLLIHSRN
jgi:hypothetical protein